MRQRSLGLGVVHIRGVARGEESEIVVGGEVVDRSKRGLERSVDGCANLAGCSSRLARGELWRTRGAGRLEMGGGSGVGGSSYLLAFRNYVDWGSSSGGSGYSGWV